MDGWMDGLMMRAMFGLSVCGVVTSYSSERTLQCVFAWSVLVFVCVRVHVSVPL